MACLVLASLPTPAMAEAQVYPFCASEFDAAGYPSPEVPVSKRAPDSYFTGAVLVGDSLASAFEIHGVVPELTTLTNVGLSARTATGNKTFLLPGAKREIPLVEALDALEPTSVYLWLGANGLNAKDEERTLEDYDQLLNYLLPHYPDLPVYLLSVTPLKAKVAQNHPKFTNERVVSFNTGLRALAKKHNVYYLDVHALLVNEKGELSDDYGAGDGLHLRTPAYDLLADYLYTHTIPREE